MLPFFKPTTKNTGSLANFSFNSKGEKKGIFIEMVKQTGWNPQSRTGSFKGGDKVLAKLSLIEASALIRAIEKNVKASEKPFYHSSNAGVCTINFGPFERGGSQIGFSLGMTKQEAGETEKKNFLIGFDFNESRLLLEWLKYAISHVFDGMYSDQVKAAREARQNNS